MLNDLQARAQRISPFDSLGTDVKEAPHAEEALTLAGLDFTVEKAPLFAQVGENYFAKDPILRPLENSYTLVRQDTLEPFSCKVTDRYVPFQNHDVIGFLDTLADLGCTFSQGGSYKGGARCWMTMTPPEGTLYRDEGLGAFDSKILAVWTHDGSGAVRFIPVVTDLFCTNQLSGLLKQKHNVFVARHTASLEGKVQQAREAMGVQLAYFDDFLADQARLDAIDVNMYEILDVLFPMREPNGEPIREGAKLTKRSNARSTIHQIHNARPENNLSAWGVVSAINEYESWGKGVRGGNRALRQLEAVVDQRFPLTQKARVAVLQHV